VKPAVEEDVVSQSVADDGITCVGNKEPIAAEKTKFIQKLQCSYCGTLFTRMSSVKRHLRLLHSIKNVREMKHCSSDLAACTECGTPILKRNVNRHLKDMHNIVKGMYSTSQESFDSYFTTSFFISQHAYLRHNMFFYVTTCLFTIILIQFCYYC